MNTPESSPIGREDKQARGSWLTDLVRESKSQIDPASLDLLQMAELAEIEVARKTPPAAPDPGPMDDGLHAAENFPVELEPGEVCKVALCTCCRDAFAQGAGQSLGAIFFSLLSASAIKVVGPLCCICGSTLSIAGCVYTYKGLRGKEPGYANWGTCLAFATGLTFGLSSLAAAAIQLTAGRIHSAQLTAAFAQGAIALIRNLARDTIVSLLKECNGAVIATDHAGVNQGLNHSPMARMEAARLWGSCLCYMTIYAVLLGWGQGAIGSALNADKLAEVIERGGSFEDMMLALAPGGIAGVIGEAADGCAGPLCATLSAFACGNKAVVQPARGPLKALADNVRSKQAIWEAAVRGCQNASVRYFMGTFFRDLNFLASVEITNEYLDAIIDVAGSTPSLLVAQSITEWRGPLLAAYLRLRPPPPEQERMDGDADHKARATVFVSELGFTEVDADTLRSPRSDGKQALEAVTHMDPARGEVSLIESCLRPGASFRFRGVGCRVEKVDPETQDVVVGSRAPLGRNWVCDPRKDKNYPFVRTVWSHTLAKLLHAGGLRYQHIERVSDEVAMQAGLRAAMSLRGIDGKEDEHVERNGAQYKVGDEVGSLPAVARELLRKGRTVRDLNVPGAEMELALFSRPVVTTGHMEDLLKRIESRFTLAPKAGLGQQAVISCKVTEHGTEASLELPGLLPGAFRHDRESIEPEGFRYRANNDEFAEWLLANFKVTETRSISTLPMAADRRVDEKGAHRRATPEPALGPSASSHLRAGHVVMVGGERCVVERVRAGPGTIVLKTHQSVELLEEQVKGTRFTTRFPRLFGPDVWRYELAPEVLDNILATSRQRDESAGGIAPERLAERAAQLTDGARSAIRRLMPVFGAPLHRESRSPSSEVVDIRRQDNQDMLSTIVRLLNGRSFLQGSVRFAGGVPSLLDLTGFSEDEIGSFRSTFDQIEAALASGVGSPVADMRSDAMDAEEDLANMLKAVMPDELGRVVSEYVSIPNLLAHKMADAAVLLAAGMPADSPAREAARQLKRYADTQGQSGVDPRALLDDLRADFRDPLRQEALAYLEREITKLAAPTQVQGIPKTIV